MDVTAKLPTMDDGALAILHANAERLMRLGTPSQQAAALALLPSIKAELTVRSAAKRSKSKAEAPARKRAVKPATAAAR
ncbi:MAG TPA: hypothetical protein VF014_05165 [Casimicrobiaceae bacterium]|nr:hypothetical protein [Casimicrobiaceae bacterium]